MTDHRVRLKLTTVTAVTWLILAGGCKEKSAETPAATEPADSNTSGASKRASPAPEPKPWGTDRVPFLVDEKLYLGEPGKNPVEISTDDIVIGRAAEGTVECRVSGFTTRPAVGHCGEALFALLDCPTPIQSRFVATGEHAVTWYPPTTIDEEHRTDALDRLKKTELFGETVKTTRDDFSDGDFVIHIHVVPVEDVESFAAPDTGVTYARARFSLSEREDGGYHPETEAGPAGGYVEAFLRLKEGEATLYGDAFQLDADSRILAAADLDGDEEPEFLREIRYLGSRSVGVVDPSDDEVGLSLETCERPR